MSKVGLTPKQQQVYDFLRVYHKTNGYYPSVREIAAGRIDGQQMLEERTSTSSIRRQMSALKERGWISVMPGKARSITLL